MTSNTKDGPAPGLSLDQRRDIISQLARDWAVVHGDGPGCTTGLGMLTDGELLAEARSYRSRAEAKIGDDR